jgi:hypothetical protein
MDVKLGLILYEKKWQQSDSEFRCAVMVGVDGGEMALRYE